MKHLLLTTIAAVLLVGWGPSVDIHQAAMHGNTKAVKQHLAAGVDVNAKDKYGRTPLHMTPINGHKEIVELLISKGADVNVRDDLGGRTPLHQAASSGHKVAQQIAELLITKGADVNAKMEDGRTPLNFTESKEHKEIADLLRKHGGKTGEELK
ncbi:ankyrin repeat domain-containing protein [Verrucomicrobia bacterium]|nr:ankyrin repeat domain-containing protein [Verrucomicrobiota bacterium]